MHPLDYGNAVDFDSSLAYLDDHSLEEVVRKVSGFVDPFVVSHGRVVAKTGETIYGEFITLPRTAEQLAGMRKEDAAAYVRGALHLARDRGAEMVGLALLPPSLPWAAEPLRTREYPSPLAIPTLPSRRPRPLARPWPWPETARTARPIPPSWERPVPLVEPWP